MIKILDIASFLLQLWRQWHILRRHICGNAYKNDLAKCDWDILKIWFRSKHTLQSNNSKQFFRIEEDVIKVLHSKLVDHFKHAITLFATSFTIKKISRTLHNFWYKKICSNFCLENISKNFWTIVNPLRHGFIKSSVSQPFGFYGTI